MNFKNVSNGNVYSGPSYAEYPVVSDLSSFRPDHEMVRAYKFNPAPAGGSTPVYDYPDGQIPDDDPITPEIVALRQGKLDRADADALKENIIQSAKQDSDRAHAEKILGAIDKSLGIDSGSTEKSE